MSNKKTKGQQAKDTTSATKQVPLSFAGASEAKSDSKASKSDQDAKVVAQPAVPQQDIPKPQAGQSWPTEKMMFRPPERKNSSAVWEYFRNWNWKGEKQDTVICLECLKAGDHLHGWLPNSGVQILLQSYICPQLTILSLVAEHQQHAFSPQNSPQNKSSCDLGAGQQRVDDAIREHPTQVRQFAD
jgi:hypothetical protein